MLNPYLHMILCTFCFLGCIILTSIEVSKEEKKKKTVKEIFLLVGGVFFLCGCIFGDIPVAKYGKTYIEDIDIVDSLEPEGQQIDYVITKDLHKIYITDMDIDTKSGTNQIIYKKLLGRISIVQVSITQDVLDEVLSLNDSEKGGQT